MEDKWKECFFQRVKDAEDMVRQQEERVKHTAQRYVDGDTALSDLRDEMDMYERTETHLSILESMLFEMQIFPEYRGWQDKNDERWQRYKYKSGKA